MEHGIYKKIRLIDVSDRLLNAVRRYLIKYRLLTFFRVFRLVIHFGPWRPLPQFLIRMLRPVVQSPYESHTSLLGQLDTKAIADEVRNNSVAVAGVLSSDFVNQMRITTDRLPVDHYQKMQHIDENVRRLSEDVGVKNVLREYFKCEPVLLEATLGVTGSHEVYGISGQNSFHFDYAGWQSLNVFVYLSDMAEGSSCHIVACGSHRKKTLRDLFRDCPLTESEAQTRFGSAIKVITGVAGTVFFENTEAFHRRHPGNERRVMLNLLYASHRNWLSHGRASRDHLKRRAQAYAKFHAVKN